MRKIVFTGIAVLGGLAASHAQCKTVSAITENLIPGRILINAGLLSPEKECCMPVIKELSFIL